MTNEERKQLCRKCKPRVNKANAEYMVDYRRRKKAEALSIKKFGLDV